jgi:hypothetical protein
LQQNDRLRCRVFAPIRFIEPLQYALTFDHAAFNRLLNQSVPFSKRTIAKPPQTFTAMARSHLSPLGDITIM